MHRTIEASRAAARWSGALARFVVLATGAPWAPAHAQVPAAVDAAALMPDSFGNVQLGMTQADLLRARPAIRPDGFKGDNAGHAKLLFEKGKTDFIDQALYLFDEKKPLLAAVMFIRQQPTRTAAQGAPAFRAAAAAKWGSPDQIAYARGETGGREVAMAWRRQDAIVIANDPADAKAVAFTVRIGAPGSIVDAYASKLETMDKATQDKLKQEMRDQLRKVPATVKYQ